MKKANLVLTDANIWTVDSRVPHVQAVAIQGEEIVALGKNEEMEPLEGPETQVISLNGRLVLPGFNDSHTHFIGSLTRTAGAFDLYGVTSLAEVREPLRKFSWEHPDSEWLIGNRWKPSIFEDGGWPTRASLDSLEPVRPVAIFDIDCHSCWVNTAALQKLGYTGNTLDPLGGKIVHDEQGEPNGILLENAHDSIPRGVPLTAEEFSRALCEEVAHLNCLGLTSLSNNGVKKEQLEIYAQMAEDGRLTLRINEWPFLSQGLEYAQGLRERFGKGERVRVVGLKVLIDGVLSAHTAWMLEDYADAPGKTGFPTVDPEQFEQEAIEADRQGFQVIVHAIGDRGIRRVLDIYEKARKTNGDHGQRHRIEHVEVAHPDDQKRFARLNVIASMTPLHCTADIDAYIKSRLGESRSPSAYAWRNFIDLGTHLCFGTDWPAVSLQEPDPLKQIYSAVTRLAPNSQAGPAWHPEQCITVAEAVRSYTFEPAYAEFMEDRKGSISPGKLADLIVLSDNILTAPPEAILDTKVMMTIFNGEVVTREF